MTDTLPHKAGPLFVAVLAAITAIAPLALHMFFPAVPAVKADFGISDATAELTLSVPPDILAQTVSKRER